MGLKEQIRLEEEQLRKMDGDPSAVGEMDVDGDEGDENATPPAKNSTQNTKNVAEDEDESDAAKGKKPEKSAKKEGEEDDEDESDAAKGKKPEKSAKKEGEEGENSLAAQLRIERKQRKAMEKRLEELLARAGTPAPAKPAEKPAGDVADGAEAAAKQPSAEERLNRIEQEREQQRLEAAAVEEFTTYEREFANETPDYAQASNHMIRAMAQSVRNLYPNATDAQVGTFIRQQILHIAGQAAQKGVNPAEALYLMAHERFGYTKPQAAPKNRVEDATKKLETIANNKKRSASPLAGGGQHGSASATLEEAAGMSLADFSKLKAGEIEALINEAQDM